MLINYMLEKIEEGIMEGIMVKNEMYMKKVKMILKDEKYEDEDGGNKNGEEEVEKNENEEKEEEDREEEGEEMKFGSIGNKMIENIVEGEGFEMIMGGVDLMIGSRIKVKNGILWGIEGLFEVELMKEIGI